MAEHLTNNYVESQIAENMHLNGMQIILFFLLTFQLFLLMWLHMQFLKPEIWITIEIWLNMKISKYAITFKNLIHDCVNIMLLIDLPIIYTYLIYTYPYLYMITTRGLHRDTVTKPVTLQDHRRFWFWDCAWMSLTCGIDGFIKVSLLFFTFGGAQIFCSLCENLL